MQGLLNWQAIRELKFAPMKQNVGGGSAVNWNEIAAMYDGMTKLERASAYELVAAFPITNQDSVLDIGCGPGRLSVPMAKRAKSVTALDAFANMLGFCKQNAANEGVENINFIQKSWLDDDILQTIGKHDVIVASRSVGLGDLKKLHAAANKFVVITCFLDEFASLREVWLDLLQGIKEPLKSPLNPSKNARMFGYNVTFNLLYDLGANVNVRIFDTIYERDFSSPHEAYEHLKFVGEIPSQKEEIFKSNVDKWLISSDSGVKFYRATKSYALWYDVREIKGAFE
ncbi:MAG: class I SAM-dependent methyltransferase [Campylobacter sp.]|nr:class I SAM-dependent methyltransferase [Campylobacter sp.]